MAKNKNLVSRINRYETGKMDARETERFFQEIVSSGAVKNLGPAIKQTADAMVAFGVIEPAAQDA